MKIIVCLAILFAMIPCLSAEQAIDATKSSPTQVMKTFQGRALGMQVPKNLPDTGRGLLLWCHPASGDPMPEFKFWKSTKLFTKDTILLCPKAAGRGWDIRADGKYVDALLKKVVEDYNIDPDRIIMGGHSSGGFFTYAYGLQRQNTFAALMPACAYAYGRLPKPKKDVAPVIAVYHSKNDNVISWDDMMKSYKKMEKLGYQQDLTEDKLGHNIGPKLINRYKELRASVIAADTN